jgi:hypothetical protein
VLGRIPSSGRYFRGSALASFVGAGILVLSGAGDSSIGSSFAMFYGTLILFLVFLVIGWPVFLLLRNARLFSFWPVIIAGAAVPFTLMSELGFNLLARYTAVGVLTVAICWWFINLPSKSFKRDALMRTPQCK